MTSQVFNQFEIEPPQTFMLRDILPGPAWAPFRPALSEPVACAVLPKKKVATKRRRAATVLAAICFEVVVPVGVFGIWQFWVHAR